MAKHLSIDNDDYTLEATFSLMGDTAIITFFSFVSEITDEAKIEDIVKKEVMHHSFFGKAAITDDASIWHCY